MAYHNSVAKSVRLDKEAHPERYCSQCLWKTATLNPERNGYLLNVNPCGKHGRLAKAEMQNVVGAEVYQRKW